MDTKRYCALGAVIVKYILGSILLSSCYCSYPKPKKPVFHSPTYFEGYADSFIFDRLLVKSDKDLSKFTDRQVYVIDLKEQNRLLVELFSYIRALEEAPVWSRSGLSSDKK